MARTNEEIILSSLYDRVMTFCNELNKRLDDRDEITQPVQPFLPYLPAQPQIFHSADQPWQQTYQFGVPSWEEPMRHSQPPGPNTQPWQQPPDPPDWQHNTQRQPYGSHDFGATDLVAHGHTVATVFSAETYTIPVTMAPPCTSLTDQQTHLNEYTQPHTSCNRIDWYNRSTLLHGQPNHNPNFGGFPPHQFQQPQHEPNCQPSCWEPPKYQPPQGYPPNDQHPAHQTSWWESSGNSVHLGFAQYGQPPFTNTESLNGPPTQYTTSTFGQSLYSSDMPLQNPYAGYHSGLPEYQSTPAPYQPPMDVEDVIEPQHENGFNPEPLLKQIVEIPKSTRIDGSVRVLYTEQDTTQQCLDKAREMKPTRDIQSSGLGEKTLPSENYIPGNVVIEGIQKQLESGSQSILSAIETCVWLNEDTDECIEDAKDDHSDVKNFFKYTKGEGKPLFRELVREGEWQVIRDLHGGDVAGMNHRPTLLDGDARLIPPRNDTLYLSVIGRVDKLSILARNFDNHIGPPLMIFDRDEEGRRFLIRCAFDPGGNSSPKLLFVKLFIVSWFPP